MNKVISLILSVFIAGLAIADPNGGCNFKTGSPACVAFTGKGLTLATQGPQDITFKTNDTSRGTINGSTGAWTGLTLASPTITGTVTVGALAGASPITVSPGSDANRLFSFGASSDAAHTITFGDVGVTATQTLLFSASTADADDDSTITISSGGAFGATRGGGLIVSGNELATTGGSFRVISGDVATANADLEIENASSSIRFRDTTTGTLWSITDAGVLTADATNGGKLIMSKAGTGLIAGTTALSATATTPLGAPGATLESNVNSTGNVQLGIVGFGANIYGGEFYSLKTRAVTDAATTVVSSGDNILRIMGYGADGTVYRLAAGIVMTVDGTPGSGDMPGAIDFQTSPDGSAALASVLKLGNDKVAQFTGFIRSSATSDLGWAVVAGANAACNTTCTSACVVGFDTTAGVYTMKACTDATSDICLCAGAS